MTTLLRALEIKKFLDGVSERQKSDPADTYVGSVLSEASGQDSMTSCPLFSPGMMRKAFYKGAEWAIDANARHIYERLPQWPLGDLGHDIDSILEAARNNSSRQTSLPLRRAIRRIDQAFNYGYLALILKGHQRWDKMLAAMTKHDIIWTLYPDECADQIVKIISSGSRHNLTRFPVKTSMMVCLPESHEPRMAAIQCAEVTLRYRLVRKGCGENMPAIWEECRAGEYVRKVTVYGTRPRVIPKETD